MPADLPSSFLIPPVIASSTPFSSCVVTESVKKSMVWTRLMPDVRVPELDDLLGQRGQQVLELLPLDLELLAGQRGRPLLLGEPEVGLLAPLRDLDLALLGPEGRLGLLREVLELVDPDDVAFLDVGELGRPHDRVQGLLPGDVLELDRHLALDVLARDDVEPAELGEDAEDVVDVRVLEVQRDEAGPLRPGRPPGRRSARGAGPTARGCPPPRLPSPPPRGSSVQAQPRRTRTPRLATPLPPILDRRDRAAIATGFPTVRPVSAAGARRSAPACRPPGLPPGPRTGRDPAPTPRPSRRTSPR